MLATVLLRMPAMLRVRRRVLREALQASRERVSWVVIDVDRRGRQLRTVENVLLERSICIRAQAGRHHELAQRWIRVVHELTQFVEQCQHRIHLLLQRFD